MKYSCKIISEENGLRHFLIKTIACQTHEAFSHSRNAVVRHQLHLDWPNHYFASEMRKKVEPSSTFCAENWRNFSAHEQTVFCERYFAFSKDFSQWKSGFTVKLYFAYCILLTSLSYFAYRILSNCTSKSA